MSTATLVAAVDRQMLYHIVMVVEMLPQDVRMIRRSAVISLPSWLLHWANICHWQASQNAYP
jgi:hypothetical protein